jgi:hypothetical protein
MFRLNPSSSTESIDPQLLASLMGEEEDPSLDTRLSSFVLKKFPARDTAIIDTSSMAKPVRVEPLQQREMVQLDAMAASGSLYPKLPPLPNFVPRTRVQALLPPEKKSDYTSKNYVAWMLSKPIYQTDLTALTSSITGDRGVDKRAITGYVQSVRNHLNIDSNVASRIALFEEAIQSAVYYCKRSYKADFEAELRSQFYQNLIEEEAIKVRSIFTPERKEENPDIVLSPIYKQLDAIKTLSGNRYCSPLKDLYSRAFGSYTELFTPMRQLHDAYHAERDLGMSQVFKNRWQQLAQVFSVLFDTPRILKPGFALGEPVLIQDAFIIKK